VPIDESKWSRKNEFEEYVDKVYNFLNEHYPNAYTYVEISNGIGLEKNPEAMGYDWAYWLRIVKTLQELDRIETKIIDGMSYYRAKE
jgi:hypothetical protein